MNDLYIMHYGVGHDKGGHSGRYPWGSGRNPYGRQGKVPSSDELKDKIYSRLEKNTKEIYKETWGEIRKNRAIKKYITKTIKDYEKNKPKEKSKQLLREDYKEVTDILLMDPVYKDFIDKIVENRQKIYDSGKDFIKQYDMDSINEKDYKKAFIKSRTEKSEVPKGFKKLDTYMDYTQTRDFINRYRKQSITNNARDLTEDIVSEFYYAIIFGGYGEIK